MYSSSQDYLHDQANDFQNRHYSSNNYSSYHEHLSIAPWGLNSNNPDNFTNPRHLKSINKNFSDRARSNKTPQFSQRNLQSRSTDKTNQIYQSAYQNKLKQNLAEKPFPPAMNLSKIEFLANQSRQLQEKLNEKSSKKNNQNQHNFVTKNTFYPKFMRRHSKRLLQQYMVGNQKVLLQKNLIKKKEQQITPQSFVVVKAYEIKKSVQPGNSQDNLEQKEDSIKFSDNKMSKIYSNLQKIQIKTSRQRQRYSNKSTLESYLDKSQHKHSKTIDSTKQSSRQTSYEAYKRRSNQQARKLLAQYQKDKNLNNLIIQKAKQPYQIPIIITTQESSFNKESSRKQKAQFPEIFKFNDKSGGNQFQMPNQYQPWEHQQLEKIGHQFILNQEQSDLSDHFLKEVKGVRTKAYQNSQKLQINKSFQISSDCLTSPMNKKLCLTKQKTSLIQRLKRLKSKNSIEKSFQQLYPQLSQYRYISYMPKVNMFKAVQPQKRSLLASDMITKYIQQKHTKIKRQKQRKTNKRQQLNLQNSK